MNNTDYIKSCAAYEKIVLDNGLTVLVCEMPQFSSVHAIYATNFGSIDREYEENGKTHVLPAGIAHFLEHKMFENEDGDAFELYAKTGASANAYTGFDRTSYIFTASENIDASLDILLSFVTKPYFTKKTVNKEQGIIGQEINMYLDNPGWRILFAMFECLYQKHYIKDDIAGSIDSIAQITPELLYKCCKDFYCPQNMVLSVAGNITKQQVLDACKRADIKKIDTKVKKLPQNEPEKIFKKSMELEMDVAKPLLCLGFKEAPPQKPCIKTEIIANMLTSLIAGSTTPLFRKLYDEGLVTSDFDGDSIAIEGMLNINFSAETAQPELVRSLILEEIEKIRKSGVDEELFNLCKNSMYGSLIQDLESVEDMASGMASTFFKGYTLYDEIEALANVTKQDIDNALQNMCLEENSAYVIIRPIKEDKQ